LLHCEECRCVSQEKAQGWLGYTAPARLREAVAIWQSLNELAEVEGVPEE
jgi:hypothetical protein